MKPIATCRKSLLAACALALSSAPALRADEPTAPGGGALGPGCAPIAQTLGLSEAQGGAIAGALREQGQREAQARRSSYRQIVASLDESQRSRLDTLIARQLDRRAAELASVLALAPEQRSELRAILTLADSRFAPSIGGPDLAQALGSILTPEQARKLADLEAGCPLLGVTSL